MVRPFLLLMLGLAVAAAMASVAPAIPSQAVTINVNRGAAGDFWSSSGAFTDSGTLADSPAAPTRSGTYHTVRIWTGTDGSWTSRVDVKIVQTTTPGVFAVTGYWTVISGTNAYATLHGTGTLSETFDANAGTVVGTWHGSVHFA
jgi:hypothetical protein